jgi:hypothetical protein
VNRKVKTKSRSNGREYSAPSELPPKGRAAYEKLSHRSQVSKDAQKLDDDVLSVIENNGEVTLPGSGQFEPHWTKRQRQFVLLVAGAVLSVVWRGVKR